MKVIPAESFKRRQSGIIPIIILREGRGGLKNSIALGSGKLPNFRRSPPPNCWSADINIH